MFMEFQLVRVITTNLFFTVLHSGIGNILDENIIEVYVVLDSLHTKYQNDIGD